MAWIVKDFIAEQKGEVKINWVVAAPSTIVEKKRRSAAEKAKQLGSAEVLADTKQGTKDEGQVSTLSQEEITSPGTRLTGGVQEVRLFQTVSAKCPYKISTSEYDRVRNAADLVQELLRIGRERISHLEGQKKSLECKLVGLRFNLEDRIIATKECKEESASAALTVQDLSMQLEDLREQVIL
jgi:hypothetical protein